MVQCVHHLIEHLAARMSEGVVGAVEYPVCPEHLVAVLQNGRPVGYSVHIYLVEVGLRRLVQVYPIIERGSTVDRPAHTAADEGDEAAGPILAGSSRRAN